MAQESVRDANAAVAKALESVHDAEADVKTSASSSFTWSEKIKEEALKEKIDRQLLDLYRGLENDANERLKEANERLEKANERLNEANERLNEARSYHLQLTQSAHQASARSENLERIRVEERDIEEWKKELKYYEERGRCIQANCQPYCDKILNKIDELFKENAQPLPFICVEGSSGMGKSQLAFALAGRRPYFYWLATPLGLTSQPLYKNFRSISLAFRDMVTKDNPTGKNEIEILNSQSSTYLNKELWTYGFIRALVEHASSDQKQMIRFDNEVIFDVKPCIMKTVCAEVDKIKTENKPFFVLDEMNANDNYGGKNMAAFQRNVFRACGLVVIIMGTDSKITNMIEQSGGSYEEPHKWLSLVPRFPSYQVFFNDEEERHQHWSMAVDQYPFLKEIVMQSRGRFARYFTDKVVECMINDGKINLCDLLDNSFAYVSLRTHEGKHFLRSQYGKDAQLMAISFTNTSREEERLAKKPRREVGAKSMHLHFANLVDEQVTDITLSHGVLTTTSDGDWKPKCCFPAMDEDVLLYLAILGGKEFPSYYDHESGNKGLMYSTKYIFAEEKSFPVHENTNAVSKDYKFYEDMVAHAIFCASRRNGVRGVPFNDFFAYMLGEFQDKTWKRIDLTRGGNSIVASDLFKGYDAVVSKISTLNVPFLAPPNAEWPKFVIDANHHDCNFGHLVRAQNSNRCDLYVQNVKNIEEKAMFLCECKYREKNVDKGTMKGIIDGLNAAWNWEIVLVFCESLAKFRKGWDYPSIGCVKISHKGVAEWIFQPTERNRKHLLIVVETRSNDSTQEGDYEMKEEEKLEISSHDEEHLEIYPDREAVVQAEAEADTTAALEEGDANVDESACRKSKKKKRL